MSLFRVTWSTARPVGNPFAIAEVIGVWGRSSKRDAEDSRTALIEAETSVELTPIVRRLLGSDILPGWQFTERAWAFPRPTAGGGA